MSIQPEFSLEAFVDFFNQYSRRLATTASIVLIVLMSLSVADTVLFFVRNLEEGTVSPAAVGSEKPDAARGEHIDIGDLNLFGIANEGAPAAVEAPETNLNLELQGVFTAADPSRSSAIVAERNKNGKLYQIGDHLPGNAVLKAVYDDHIIIARGGRLEKLMFSKSKAANQEFGTRPSGNFGVYRQSSNNASYMSPNRLQSLRQRIAQRRREIAAERARQTNQSPGATIRDYVEHFHHQIETNPKAVLNQLGVSPVTSGQADGYRIGSNVPQQMLAQAGLQQGDVILSVNGTPVGDVANDKSLVNQVIASGRARVEIQRGERKFFLTVPIPK